MILAINLNAAIDQILFIDRFIPGAHNRAREIKTCIGGKGLDAALVLKTLGAPCRAITFVAGKNGKTLVDLLAQQGIETELIWAPGETRIAHVVVETDIPRHSHITTLGYTVDRPHLDTFLDRLAAMSTNSTWAIIAGTLPPGASLDFYKEVIDLLHSRQVKVLIDCFGAPMREAIGSVPEIVKMNQREVHETLDGAANDLAGWMSLGGELRDQFGLRNLVITCGVDGILAFTTEGRYHAGAPILTEVNAAGAGDAVSAALVYRLSLGDSWAKALAWAAATSASVVITEGTAECTINDILRILPDVWVNKI
jgi:1-phosphofructokinase family hexose kinase